MKAGSVPNVLGRGTMDGGEWLASCSSPLTPRKIRPSNQRLGSRVYLAVGAKGLKKRKISSLWR